MKIGLQCYTLRKESEKDFPAVLEYAAKLGFDGVELAGLYGMSAEAIRKELDRLDLVCCSQHIGFDDVVDRPEQIIATNQTLGAKYAVIYGISGLHTADQMIEIAEKLRAVYPIYRENGIAIGYHNHDHEFAKDNGTFLLDTLLEQGGGDVLLELDTFWSTVGGADTPEYMKKFQSVIPLIHLKDGTGRAPCAIGEGETDVRAVLNTASQTGVEWAIVENDNPMPNGFEDVARSMAALKRMGF